jgi:hypothetical protein
MVSVQQLPPRPPRPPRGTVYAKDKPDYLVWGAVAFFVVAVTVGGIFAWQGLRDGEPAALPTANRSTHAPSPTGGPGSVAQPTPTQASDAIPAGPATIRSATATLCLAPGDRATLAECADAPELRWTVTALPEQADVYLITNASNGKCLDVNGGARDDGTAILVWDCHRQANQQWRVRRTGDGHVDLVNVATDKCVDVPAQASGPGTQLQQWSCHGGPNQRWTFAATG